jgi:hypothetical protein
VQAVAVAEDLDGREVGVAGTVEALGEVGREGEGAAIGSSTITRAPRPPAAWRARSAPHV